MNELRELSGRLRAIVGLEHDQVGVCPLRADSSPQPLEHYERFNKKEGGENAT
jgi:hypothetical protein